MVALLNTQLEFEYGGRHHQFNYVWLRDNCPCEQCVHSDTRERILVTSEIADDIAPSHAQIERNTLRVVWNQDNHQSGYPSENLQFFRPLIEGVFRQPRKDDVEHRARYG